MYKIAVKLREKRRKTLTECSFGVYCFAIIHTAAKGITMFNDMFNFKKQRNLKESVGFFLFYAMMIMGFQGFAMMLGL